jgi:hypothetical protein
MRIFVISTVVVMLVCGLTGVTSIIVWSDPPEYFIIMLIGVEIVGLMALSIALLGWVSGISSAANAKDRSEKKPSQIALWVYAGIGSLFSIRAISTLLYLCVRGWNGVQFSLAIVWVVMGIYFLKTAQAKRKSMTKRTTSPCAAVESFDPGQSA